MQKVFDLNMETVLENWEISDAIREIIANGIDEATITGTKEIAIYEEESIWHIRDFGRGLNHTHFTQNESQEKIKRKQNML